MYNSLLDNDFLGTEYCSEALAILSSPFSDASMAEIVLTQSTAFGGGSMPHGSGCKQQRYVVKQRETFA